MSKNGELKGLGLFALEIIHLISAQKVETVKEIESHLATSDLVEYLNEKYINEFSIRFDNSVYNNVAINEYFANYRGYIEGNENRKYGIITDQDGLLLILALLMDKVERECINW